MPKHIARLLLLIVVGLVLAYVGKVFFTSESFYRYGHYRGASPAEVASAKPLYAGSATCERCHVTQYAAWTKGVHHSVETGRIVQCEVCHGPAGMRDAASGFIAASTGKTHPDGVKMSVPTSPAAVCTQCHEKMTGRPAEQKQIVVAEHAGDKACTACHDPHSPRSFKTVAPPGGDAKAGAAVATGCETCHGKGGVATDPRTPSLAGQRAVYLAQAIKSYRTGERVHPVMQGLAESLTPANIEDVSVFYGQANCKSIGNGLRALAVRGEASAAQCAACHGARGVSTQPALPNLAGLSQHYLLASLSAYRSGARKDPMMQGIAKNLADADAQALAAYYANAACR
jgi:cytochrome c553